VMKSKVQNNTVKAGKLTRGIYMVKLILRNQTTVTKKIIKE
jgi:hypothetical protein